MPLTVSVAARLQRDAQLICNVLEKAGMRTHTMTVEGPESLVHATEGGCLVLAEELLDAEIIGWLRDVLLSEPPWSDFPVILLTLAGEVSLTTQKRREFRGPLRSLILLERPIRPETLISTVQNALRARARQYQIRDQIEQYKRAEQALRQSEKLAVAGRLASSIAHEINNPLEAVTNLLYLMRVSDNMDQVKGYLQIAESELARVSEITSHMLQFYRQRTKPGPVQLAEILDSALTLFQRRMASAGITVEKKFEPILPIWGLSGELRQLFSNLLGNSLDAMRNGGRLVLHIRNMRDFCNQMAPGVRVTIADTGFGVPPELRSRIFEPFVTTKDDTGTGLGLWISSEIVQKHGGRIRLKSCSQAERSTGTAFTIFFPRNHMPQNESAA